MHTSDVSTLYAFNRWANDRVLTASAGVAADQFARDLGASHRSLHATLLHILWAEWLWARRWRGESPKGVFMAKDFPDVPAIRAQWLLVESQQLEFIKGLTDERLT